MRAWGCRGGAADEDDIRDARRVEQAAEVAGSVLLRRLEERAVGERLGVGALLRLAQDRVEEFLRGATDEGGRAGGAGDHVALLRVQRLADDERGRQNNADGVAIDGDIALLDLREIHARLDVVDGEIGERFRGAGESAARGPRDLLVHLPLGGHQLVRALDGVQHGRADVILLMHRRGEGVERQPEMHDVEGGGDDRHDARERPYTAAARNDDPRRLFVAVPHTTPYFRPVPLPPIR